MSFLFLSRLYRELNVFPRQAYFNKHVNLPNVLIFVQITSQIMLTGLSSHLLLECRMLKPAPDPLRGQGRLWLRSWAQGG